MTQRLLNINSNATRYPLIAQMCSDFGFALMETLMDQSKCFALFQVNELNKPLTPCLESMNLLEYWLRGNHDEVMYRYCASDSEWASEWQNTSH